MASKRGTSVRIDPETHRIIRDIAFLGDKAMADVVRAAIGEYIAERSALAHRLAVLQKAVDGEKREIHGAEQSV